MDCFTFTYINTLNFIHVIKINFQNEDLKDAKTTTLHLWLFYMLVRVQGKFRNTLVFSIMSEVEKNGKVKF